MIAGSSSIFLKCISNKSCSWAALLKFWFQTDLGRKNSTGFYLLGRQSLLTFLTIVTRWSRSSSNFYALIGQNLKGEFMRQIYAASGNLLTDSWDWQGFVPSCDVFNCLFLLDVPNETELLTRLFCVIHGWFVYCAFGLEMHSLSQSHWKSDFGWHRFQKWAYPPALTWRVKRGLKSLKPFWPDLMTFRSSISTVKPEQLLSLMCFSFSVSWGRA